jgi:N-acetylglucosaminyldiphosphoundecaprenol N-acetyl-beta-D-mannosaminyltransferase
MESYAFAGIDPQLLHTIDRANILGVGVSVIDQELAARAVEGWVAARQPNYVCVATANALVECQFDKDFRRIHNEAGLVTPDGVPLVWIAKIMGYRTIKRVYGPDLMLNLCQRSLSSGLSHFFYGGRPGVAELLAEKLVGRFPGLLVAGTGAPPVYPGTTRYRPLEPEESASLICKINKSGADIVWVGLGTPHQERWIAQHKGVVNAPVLIGVGAAFDFHTGLVKQAPRWMRNAGLEWSFRLLMEPRRLWRRYLVNNSIFVGLVLRQLITGKVSLDG